MVGLSDDVVELIAKYLDRRCVEIEDGYSRSPERSRTGGTAPPSSRELSRRNEQPFLDH